MSLLNVPSTPLPHFLNTCCLTDATYCLTNASKWNQTKPLCVALLGMNRLVIWPIRSQTQLSVSKNWFGQRSTEIRMRPIRGREWFGEIPRCRVQHTDWGKPTEKSESGDGHGWGHGSQPDHRRLSCEAKFNYVRQPGPWSSTALTSFLWMKPRTLRCWLVLEFVSVFPIQSAETRQRFTTKPRATDTTTRTTTPALATTQSSSWRFGDTVLPGWVITQVGSGQLRQYTRAHYGGKAVGGSTALSSPKLQQQHRSRVVKGETSARKEKWENVFSGKQLDSVQEETLAVPFTGKPRETDAITDTDPIPVKEHNRPLQLRERWVRLTEESLVKMAVQEEQVPQDWKAEDRVKIFLNLNARNRRVISGTFPYAWITSLNPGASVVTVVISDTPRLVGSPVKSQRKVAEKDHWSYWKRLFSWVVCPKIALRESVFCGKMESWDRIAQSSSRRPRCVTQKNGKERVHHRESWCINVYLRNELRGLQSSRKERQTKP